MTAILPPELEYLIFSIAFKSDPENNLHLSLVAKRVHHWIIPFIYEVVIFHSERIWPPSGLYPPNLPIYGQHVRHLFFSGGRGVSESDNTTYLTHCSNLVTVALWIPEPYRDPKTNIPFIESLANLPHLRELCINTDAFVETPSKALLSVLGRVTHLDIIYDISSWEDCLPFLYFTTLTHLCVFPTTDAQLLSTILEKLPELQVLLLWKGTDDPTITEDDAEGVEDERLVCLECNFVKGWEKGVRGLTGPWKFADEMIERRRLEKERDHKSEDV